MNLFCFLPRAAFRLKLGACLCAALMASSLVARAQSSGTSSDNSGTTQINNPKGHNVSNGNYVPPPPPSGPNVYYNHRWDIYAGATYTNFLAGPALFQRSNMGGWEAAGSYWFGWHWGMMADARMYIGTSGVFPNVSPYPATQGRPNYITGPRIMQYYFMAGPEYRVFRRAKASGTFHTLFGNAWGIFDAANLNGENVQSIGLFADQFTFGSAIGGTFDYNYTPRIAFRIQPEMLMTHYGGTMQQNFGFSVGPLFRLGKLNTESGPKQPSPAGKSHRHRFHL